MKNVLIVWSRKQIMKKSLYIFIGVAIAWFAFFNGLAIYLSPDIHQIGFAGLNGKLTVDVSIFYGMYRLILYIQKRRNKAKTKTPLNI